MADWLSTIPNREWEVVLLDKNINKTEHLNVVFSKVHERRPCPNFDAGMGGMWNEICKNNPRLFNGTKFRLDRVVLAEGKLPEIQIGVTDYKTYQCTNQSPSINELYAYGVNSFGNKQACLADPIAVNVVVETMDGYIVLMRRADWVGECKGMLDVPGGHAEPEDLLKQQGVSSSSSIYEIDGKHVAREIFHSVVREIRDELNIPEESILWPSFLGIVRNKNIGYRPNIVFETRCQLNKCDIEQKYKQGGLETDESTELMFVPTKDLQLEDKSDKLTLLIDSMSPCGQAAIYMRYYNNKS